MIVFVFASNHCGDRMFKQTLLLSLVLQSERFGPKRITGIIERIDPIERRLIIEGEEDRKMIPLAQIVGVEEV